MKNILKIVFVIIGTIVGAGFASGKEIYSFFFVYGTTGVFSLLFACFIIGLIIYNVLINCEKKDLNTYEEFCKMIEDKIKGKRFVWFNVSKVFAVFINVFLLIMFYVMVSGFSSFLYQEFTINRIVGSLIIVVLCYIVFVGNINKLLKVSNYLIPFLIFFIIYISGKSAICGNYIDLRYIFNCEKLVSSCVPAICKGVLYASYNCIVLIPVLIQIRGSVKLDRKSCLLISFISACVTCVLSFAIYNLLLQGDYEVFNMEMPVVGIAKNLSTLSGFIYSGIIGIAIFTSAASSGVRFLK